MKTKINTKINTKIYLEFVFSMIEDSRKILKNYFNQVQEGRLTGTKIKTDGSPVTLADKEVETIFCQGIRENFKNHAILGEEFGRQNSETEADFLWVIDPIDGTRSFMNGNKNFGSLLALLYKGKAILGVADLPLLNETYWSISDNNAFMRNEKNETSLCTRKTCTSLSQATLRSTSLEFFKEDKEKDLFQKLSSRTSETKMGGDCVCYLNLTLATADLVLEANLAPWDFMALVPIIEGAGGKISDWQGGALSTDISKNPRGKVLASANEQIHQQALDYIKSTELL